MKRAMQRALAATGAAVLAGGLLSATPAQADGDVTINLVAVNDFHGRIDENVVQWAATVQQLLADGSNGGSLLVSAGDNVGATLPASAAQDDDPTIDVLNLLGVDASAVGNHEFDKGYDDLVNHIMVRADFPFLGANVKKSDGSPALDASSMHTVNGVRVAVIGAVTDDTPNLVPPSGIVGLSFIDPVTGINAEVDRLNALPESEQPDVIVTAIHEGAPWGTWALDQAMQSSNIFRRMVEDTSPDVDAIIMGHTHNTHVYNAPVPGEEGRTRPIIQTGDYGTNVGQIQLTFTPDTGEVTAHTARNVARVTTSDESLIPTSSTLATVAQIRDDAVAFAAAQAEEAEEVKSELEAAELAGDEAYAKAEALKADYDAAVAARKEAYDTAATVKDRYDAAVAEGKAFYATATDIKKAYDAAAAEGKAAYAQAADIKKDYDAVILEGRASYAAASSIKQAYDAAVAEGKAAYARAADIKKAYDTAMAEGKAAYATATTIKAAREAAIAEGKAAFDTATAVKQQYFDAMAIGDPDSSILLADLAQQFQDAMAAGSAAYTRADALKVDFDAAMATGQAAYASAALMVPDYAAASAAGKDAYARASAMGPDYTAAIAAGKDAYARGAAMATDYNTAIQAGKDAYARANAMGPDYTAAIAAGKAAYAEADGIKTELDAALAAADEAEAEANAVKQLLDAAVETLNALLATVADLKNRLVDLLRGL